MGVIRRAVAAVLTATLLTVGLGVIAPGGADAAVNTPWVGSACFYTTVTQYTAQGWPYTLRMGYARQYIEVQAYNPGQAGAFSDGSVTWSYDFTDANGCIYNARIYEGWYMRVKAYNYQLVNGVWKPLVWAGSSDWYLIRGNTNFSPNGPIFVRVA
jgi:hypothetical protein